MKFKQKRTYRSFDSQRRWTTGKVQRLLANPMYCGFAVDPIFTLQRPIENGYALIAVQIIHEVGAGTFLQNFLRRLKDPSKPLPPGTTVADDRLLSSVAVHPDFAMEHPALVTEAEFVGAGIVSIAEMGAQRYMEHVLENLKGNWVTHRELPLGGL